MSKAMRTAASKGAEGTGRLNAVAAQALLALFWAPAVAFADTKILGATPDESSVVMGTPPKGAERLVDDPRYRARHFAFEILDNEYWWGGEVLEGLRQPFSRASKGYAVDMRLRHGTSGGDKAAPVLLSSKGRWVWCEQAFSFGVLEGKLVVRQVKLG